MDLLQVAGAMAASGLHRGAKLGGARRKPGPLKPGPGRPVTLRFPKAASRERPSSVTSLSRLYPMRYTLAMIEIRQTATYAEWFAGLRDRRARSRIDARIRRLSLGNFGDVKPVGEGVSELRVNYGPGYRVYLVQRGQTLVILLAGGDKSTQSTDIKTALDLARNL